LILFGGPILAHIPSKSLAIVLLVGGGGSNGSGYLGIWEPGTSSSEDLSNPAMSLSVYPSPARDVLHLSGWEDSDYSLFRLKDTGGRICLEAPLSSVVMLPDVPSGVYFAEFLGSKKAGPKQHKVLIIRN
jgi:hypothetical protein